MMHLPLLRAGTPYRSMDTRPILCPATGEPLAEVSLANPGLIRRDARASLPPAPSPGALGQALIAAARHFDSPLAIEGEGPPVDLDTYRSMVQASTGLEPSVIDEQLELLRATLKHLGEVAPSLPVAPIRRLAVVLPSNALAVNRAWLPALALGATVALKPGARDPFTPHRLVAALIAAGLPRELFSVYPSEHDATGALMSAWPRVQLFGDAQIAERYAGDPTVQVNGPGRSAVILGPDLDWSRHLGGLIEGVCRHSGRSCLNTSSIVTLAGPEQAAALADALAAEIEQGVDASGRLERPVGEAINALIEASLGHPGASERTRGLRLVSQGGEATLRPTVIHCSDPGHPLARSELAFPFVSVSSVSEEALVTWLGPTLTVATLGVSPRLTARLAENPEVERLSPQAPHSLDTPMGELHLRRMQELLQ